jgi:hypothetical protein
MTARGSGLGVDVPRSVMPVGVRLGTSVGIVVAGGTHLWLWFHGYRGASVGLPFLIDAVLSAVVGALVAVRGSRAAAWAGSALSAVALVSYALARTVGLFGFVELAWTRPSVLAAVCESAVLVLLLTEALVPEDSVPSKGAVRR